jgi:hypothetical protein
MKALLIGRQPPIDLGHTYTQQPPYDGVVIGSLELSELMFFQNQQALQALADGKPVVLYTPGLPAAPQNRALGATLAARQRELKTWGVVFTDGGRKRLITAQEARAMRDSGIRPLPGAVMTPLAKEILEG